MGCPMAPEIANLYMEAFELQYIYENILEHRLCPRWHWIVLQVGWAGNIILVAAVIALGVCVMNKNSQHPEQGAMLFSHNAHKYSHDGRNKTLEDFKSILKQKLCEAATASTENGSCHLCPVTWLLHRHKCYWFSKSIQNWMQSKGDCVAKKSQLLVIHDEEEKEFLQKNIVEKVWIGLHVTPQEKKWIWINDSPLNRTL
ncbi:killer cell lectin-like receptor subfamily B member 1B allele C [Elgaria multicarinata webbii]|uniref:killer cell lectin-like receptor subfamily B member 1B allele C n=1 Tax=Elgaria multicarinata webbii TaxID=159646 RepID=UPI002FCD4C39